MISINEIRVGLQRAGRFALLDPVHSSPDDGARRGSIRASRFASFDSMNTPFIRSMPPGFRLQLRPRFESADSKHKTPVGAFPAGPASAVPLIHRLAAMLLFTA
jgi:hypothetical protein